ncbi:tetratricopeptide repeat protein [Jeotgalibaca caeni]|uniref:tetratricopeptide repeat protein n=1 Tax=Jeotgalibaca caeni TaxID=3028623 RepID=UPI00237E3869|nr:tetratricopeptide repeat protein [Jeotgalibaca caeni]MDE1549523.1 tetratricopeptide repeat protein [Jeotgalibaca caeni]
MTKVDVTELVNRALAHHDEGNNALAEEMFLEALYLLDDKENELYQRIVYGLGMNYSAQGNLDGARQCFEEGRLNAKKANNIKFELGMIRQLIVINRDLEDLTTALLLVEEEILYREKHAPDDWSGFFTLYMEGSKLLEAAGKTKKSKEYAQKALEYKHKMNK